MSIFDFQELELLMCGMPNIDVDDWCAHTQYKGEYSADSEVVAWFWEAVRGEHCDSSVRSLASP